MPKADELWKQLSDFWGIYTLILGAIMVILGIQLIVMGLAYGVLDLVCFSLPVLALGSLLVAVMLKDRMFHRVFYRPANPNYYIPTGYEQPRHEQSGYEQPGNNLPGNGSGSGYDDHYTDVRDRYGSDRYGKDNYEGDKREEDKYGDNRYGDERYGHGYASSPAADYSAPYYGGYGQGYNTPYVGIPYLTYVQYFRKTLSIPTIRPLLIIFLISIAGGSFVLLIGGAALTLFPVFFIIAFTFPSFIWISYVYHKDILEPESRHGIFLALAWGMFSTLFALIPNVLGLFYLDMIYSTGIAMMITAVVIAPLNEEFFKPLGIRKVRDEMNTELDGLIYGVSCGMGFAIIENFTYELGFLFSGDSPAVLWTFGAFIRGLGSTIIHAVGAGFIGFSYARMRMHHRDIKNKEHHGIKSFYNLSIPAAYLVAVALHAGWNGSASIPEFMDGMYGILLSIAGHIIVFIAAFYLLRSLANEGIRRDMERHGNVPYANPVEINR